MVDFLPFHLYFCIYISALSNRLKEGIQIKSSERISITSDEGTSVYKLKIKETLAEDEGLYSLVAVNKEGETRGDIQLSVHCNVLAFSCFLFESKFVNPFRRAEPPTFTAKDAKELLCQGWRATGIRDGSHQNRESDKEGKFTLIISDYAEVWASNFAKVLIVVIIVFLFRLVNGGRQLAP